MYGWVAASCWLDTIIREGENQELKYSEVSKIGNGTLALEAPLETAQQEQTWFKQRPPVDKCVQWRSVRGGARL